MKRLFLALVLGCFLPSGTLASSGIQKNVFNDQITEDCEIFITACNQKKQYYLCLSKTLKNYIKLAKDQELIGFLKNHCSILDKMVIDLEKVKNQTRKALKGYRENRDKAAFDSYCQQIFKKLRKAMYIFYADRFLLLERLKQRTRE